MRVLKVMILGFTILCLVYLAWPSVTETGGDDPGSIGDENLSSPVADAGCDCAMPEPVQQYKQYFIVYDGENYTGHSYRVYYPGTESTHLFSLWDENGVKYSDKPGYKGHDPRNFVYIPIKSIKTPYILTLYEEENYMGYCLTITQDTPSLRRYVLDRIRSIKVRGPCPERLSTRIFNFTIQNNGGTRIKYRLTVNGEWQPLSNPIRAGKSETRSVYSNQIVAVEIQYLYFAKWKTLCKHDLNWKKRNTITVKHTLTKIWCEKQ